MSEDLTEKQQQDINESEILTAIKRLEEIQHAIHLDITALNSRMDNVDRDQRIITDSVRRMQLDFFTINEWLHNLIVDHRQPNTST